MIIMKTAFAAVPDSLIESAQLDGARHFTILTRIAVPLAVPTIVVLILYYGVGHWNSWFAASIYLQSPEKYPLQLVMRNILNSANINEMMGGVDAGDQARYVELIKYALIVVSTVPILVLYPFLQKYFVKGVMIESYIEPGSQKVGEHIYGKSITDPCLGWDDSERLLYEMAEGL